MTGDGDQEITDVTEAPAAGERTLDFDLCDGRLRLELTPTNHDPPLRITAYEIPDGGEERLLKSVYKKRDVIPNESKRQNFVGSVANDAEAVAPAHIKDEIGGVFDRLASRWNEVEDEFRPPVVEKLIAATDRVYPYITPDETYMRAELTVAGQTETLEFTSGEWVSSKNPHPVNKQYFMRFRDRLDLSKDDWAELAEAWEAMKGPAEREMADRAAIVSETTEKIRIRTTPYDEKYPLRSGEGAAYYDPDNSAGIDGADAGEPVVWVRSDAIKSILDALSTDVSLSKLSQIYRQVGVSYGPSRQKRVPYPEGVDPPEGADNRISIWPLDPREIPIDEGAVISPDDGDGDTEVDV